jgi:hypothetical protein
METIVHWTETVTDSVSLAQAFFFDHSSMKGDAVTRERLTRLEDRCAGGPDMFWAAIEMYSGKPETKRLRAIRNAC